jgi:hypothetical protein
MNGSIPEPERTPAILAAREAVRAVLAPTGRDLERLLMALHEQSARSQRDARRSQIHARREIKRRLAGKVLEQDDTGAVVVAVVTTRELIGLVEAESNIVKTEAMAQRSYDVHRSVVAGVNPAAGTVEDFITAVEEEENTERAGDDGGTRDVSADGAESEPAW